MCYQWRKYSSYYFHHGHTITSMKVISKIIPIPAGALITANSVVADLSTSSITVHTLIDICSGNECGMLPL